MLSEAKHLNRENRPFASLRVTTIAHFGSGREGKECYVLPTAASLFIYAYQRTVWFIPGAFGPQRVERPFAEQSRRRTRAAAFGAPPRGDSQSPRSPRSPAARGDSQSDIDSTGLALLKTQSFLIAFDFFHGLLGLSEYYGFRHSDRLPGTELSSTPGSLRVAESSRGVRRTPGWTDGWGTVSRVVGCPD